MKARLRDRRSGGGLQRAARPHQPEQLPDQRRTPHSRLREGAADPHWSCSSSLVDGRGSTAAFASGRPHYAGHAAPVRTAALARRIGSEAALTALPQPGIARESAPRRVLDGMDLGPPQERPREEPHRAAGASASSRRATRRLRSSARYSASREAAKGCSSPDGAGRCRSPTSGLDQATAWLPGASGSRPIPSNSPTGRLDHRPGDFIPDLFPAKVIFAGA